MIPNIDDQSLVAESVEGIARKREGEKNYEREAINEIGMESVQQKKKTCKWSFAESWEPLLDEFGKVLCKTHLVAGVH